MCGIRDIRTFKFHIFFNIYSLLVELHTISPADGENVSFTSNRKENCFPDS